MGFLFIIWLYLLLYCLCIPTVLWERTLLHNLRSWTTKSTTEYYKYNTEWIHAFIIWILEFQKPAEMNREHLTVLILRWFIDFFFCLAALMALCRKASFLLQMRFLSVSLLIVVDHFWTCVTTRLLVLPGSNSPHCPQKLDQWNVKNCWVTVGLCGGLYGLQQACTARTRLFFLPLPLSYTFSPSTYSTKLVFT